MIPCSNAKEEEILVRKALCIWLFSSLTFMATAHFVDAISVIAFGNKIMLLQLYPLIGEKLMTLATPEMYFWLGATTAFILWGITCAVAFENPVETFLNKILSDAKQQSAVETQLLEDKSEVLDAMYDTIESDNEILAQVKDLMCNVRADVKEIQPMRESMDKLKAEMSNLKKEVKKVEEKMQTTTLCPACGKPLLPEFRLCPYCGANVKTLPEKMISLKDYR